MFKEQGLSSALEAFHPMEQLKPIHIFSTLNINRRNSADNLSQVIYALLVTPLLQVSNIWCFMGEFIGCYTNGGKDVLYDLVISV